MGPVKAGQGDVGPTSVSFPSSKLFVGLELGKTGSKNAGLDSQGRRPSSRDISEKQKEVVTLVSFKVETCHYGLCGVRLWRVIEVLLRKTGLNFEVNSKSRDIQSWQGFELGSWEGWERMALLESGEEWLCWNPEKMNTAINRPSPSILPFLELQLQFLSSVPTRQSQNIPKSPAHGVASAKRSGLESGGERWRAVESVTSRADAPSRRKSPAVESLPLAARDDGRADTSRRIRDYVAQLAAEQGSGLNDEQGRAWTVGGIELTHIDSELPASGDGTRPVKDPGLVKAQSDSLPFPGV
ncbi:hypothetical protein C8R43DRAFT_1179078 [Mycena crocata]|nr:hypothetical protein C8R43DRAFT_1179078 [Mycena crocata]